LYCINWAGERLAVGLFSGLVDNVVRGLVSGLVDSVVSG
jgi:hypothetical protein